MAGDAGPVVGSESLKEGVARRINGTGGVEDADEAVGVVPIFFERKNDAAARLPPDAIRAIRTAALRYQNDGKTEEKQKDAEPCTFHVGVSIVSQILRGESHSGTGSSNKQSNVAYLFHLTWRRAVALYERPDARRLERA